MNTMLPQQAEERPVIVHVLHRLYLAGAEVLAAELARKLGGPGGVFRFTFVCLDEIGPLGEQLQQEGFEVVSLARRPGVDWQVARRLAEWVQRWKVGLIHAHQYTPFFYAAASRLPPANWTCRGPAILFTEHGRHYPDPRKWRRVLANKVLLRPGDRVTAVGRFVRDALVEREGIPGKRIQVIYNGIDPERFPQGSQAQAVRVQVRQELGISLDQVVAVQVARFHPVKDHETGLRAWAEVQRRWAGGRQPGSLLLLVGDGPQRPVMEKLTEELGIAGSVRFLGVRNDVERLLTASDLFMLSSLSEGISVTLLEAMAAGLPVAATDVGGNSEVVEEERTGFLSPRQDVQRLAENLWRLLKDPDLRRKLGAAGRQRVLERFTQARMHQEYAQLYARMLGGRGRG